MFGIKVSITPEPSKGWNWEFICWMAAVALMALGIFCVYLIAILPKQAGPNGQVGLELSFSSAFAVMGAAVGLLGSCFMCMFLVIGPEQ